MLRICFCLLAFSCLHSCMLQKDGFKDNCKKNFPGKWKYDDYSTSTIHVVRTKDKQFEYTQNGKYFYEYDIKWLEDCTYQMTFLTTSDPNPAIAREGDKLIVEIISIDKNILEYSTTFDGKLDTGTMTRID